MNAALRRLGLGLFVAIAAFASLLMRGDGPPPDDADLMVLPAPVPDHENGFLTLNAAAELLQWPEDDARAERLRSMAQGEAWDDALAERALAANELALLAFARVARNAAFQSPADAPASRGARAALDLARLLAIRAISAARGGDPEAALEDVLLLVRTGSKIGANPNGGLLHSELGFEVGEIGLRAREAASPNLALTPARSVAVTSALRAQRAAPAHWRAALASEYRAERALLVAQLQAGSGLDVRAGDGIAARLAASFPNRYLLQPNNTLKELSARVRVQQARADQPCAVLPAGLAPLTVRDLLRPNAFGHRRVLEVSLRDRSEISRCDYDARIELARAAIAVASFERERGVLPPSLDALAPAYLATVPTDPFSGGGLRFDRAQRIVYSIGSDGIDEGGRDYAAGDEVREPRVVLTGIPRG
jgi:hypothetical protein